MGNIIVGAAVLVIALLAIRSIIRARRRSGSCAFCSYAENGSCDHVGHQELDGKASELSPEDMEILKRHIKR